jgi:hypothetical protein
VAGQGIRPWRRGTKSRLLSRRSPPGSQSSSAAQRVREGHGLDHPPDGGFVGSVILSTLTRHGRGGQSAVQSVPERPPYGRSPQCRGMDGSRHCENSPQNKPRTTNRTLGDIIPPSSAFEGLRYFDWTFCLGERPRSPGGIPKRVTRIAITPCVLFRKGKSVNAMKFWSVDTGHGL